MSLPGRGLAAEKRDLSDCPAATSCASAGTTSTGEADSKIITEVYLLRSNAGGTPRLYSELLQPKCSSARTDELTKTHFWLIFVFNS